MLWLQNGMDEEYQGALEMIWHHWTYKNKDSIFSVGSMVYKGWWIFKKPIAVRQYVQSFNPSSKIMYNEYIMLKKIKPDFTAKLYLQSSLWQISNSLLQI